ncbi:MAG: hypothetical protein LBR19_01910 [Bifidobacteriaceae bacterium]|nr:hypothetical protein [Bifidobacteriaceae bacterium]
MLIQAAGRGNDSAGVGLYADPAGLPEGIATVSALYDARPAPEAAKAVELIGRSLGPVAAERAGQTTVFTATASPLALEAAVREALPEAVVISAGHSLTVLKGTGEPAELAQAWNLAARSGWQGVAHTRMATESAVTPGGSHPFSVGPDQCLIHNGSFSNHETLRKELAALGVGFDSLNDTEVGARYIAHRLAAGADMREALTDLTKHFDGFYTLLVSSASSFAIVRDAIACKPAIVAETPDLVAVASEYRYLTGMPGIDNALIFEPNPEVVYVWERSEVQQPSSTLPALV